MIPLTASEGQYPTWQKSLANAITDVDQLLSKLALTRDDLHNAVDINPDFPIKVTASFVRRMVKGDANDPLLNQVLPYKVENQIQPHYHRDPVGDLAANRQDGIIHKYHGRVLLITSGACAINCRYCFRRHFPYQDNALSSPRWQMAKTYFRNDPSIKEIILSGGDPLVISDHRLQGMLAELEQIHHIQTLRIHSRLPVVLPERITDDLVNTLSNSRLRVVLVIHSNHSQEINHEVKQALAKFNGTDIVLLNQSVLLNGINDSAEILANLSETLFDARVLPYYLHVLDKVQGAAHFAVEEDRAKRLTGEMALKLPGYLVPKLAKEQPGWGAKTTLAPSMAKPTTIRR